MVAEPKSPSASMTEVPLDAIDPTYALGVREALSLDHVERIINAYKDDEPVPNVVVYTWPGGGTYLLADGSHRCEAKLRLAARTIGAEVWMCKDEAEARRRCAERAARANEHTALTRSPADKRAAVRSILLSPHHPGLVDHAVAELCKVHKVLVRQVREKLSHEGEIPPDHPAHARHQKYKPDAVGRGGQVFDGKGGMVPKPAAQPPAAAAQPPNPTPAAVVPVPEPIVEADPAPPANTAPVPPAEPGPAPRYSADGDVLTYFRSEGPHAAVPVNEMVTLYLGKVGNWSDSVVGCEVKGVRLIIDSAAVFGVKAGGRGGVRLGFLFFVAALLHRGNGLPERTGQLRELADVTIDLSLFTPPG